MAIDAKNPEECTTFTTIPILSLAQARSADTKPKFLAELREALLNVGFMYLNDTGVPLELVDQVCEQTRLFFDENVLPLEEKEKIEMKNEKSFLGWSRVRLYLTLYAPWQELGNTSSNNKHLRRCRRTCSLIY